MIQHTFFARTQSLLLPEELLHGIVGLKALKGMVHYGF